MSNITWIGVSEKEVTGNEIKQVEQYFNIKLPNDFIECVKKYDGDILALKCLIYQD